MAQMRFDDRVVVVTGAGSCFCAGADLEAPGWLDIFNGLSREPFTVIDPAEGIEVEGVVRVEAGGGGQRLLGGRAVDLLEGDAGQLAPEPDEARAVLGPHQTEAGLIR